MPWRSRRDWAFPVAVTLLIFLGIFSLRHIPFFTEVQMLDFHNIYRFHQCPAATQQGPYTASGVTCGDIVGRSFIYPPLLYWTFIWTRAVAYEAAVVIWGLTLIGIMVLVGIWWGLKWARGRDGRVALPVMLVAWLLLMTQFPFIFSLERGNNDVLVAGAWTIVSAAVLGRRYFLAGTVAGLAFLFKLYPAVAILVVIAGLARESPRKATRLGLGVVLGAAVPSLVLFEDTGLFIRKVLPALVADAGSGPSLYAHSLPSLRLPSVVIAGLGLLLILPWMAGSVRSFSRAPLPIQAGALAVSTYFGKLGYDYSLVTAMPLLLLVLALGLEEDGFRRWKALSLSLMVALLAGRDLLPPIGLVAGQCLALGAVGVAVATWASGPSRESEEPRRVGLRLPPDKRVETMGR